MLSVVGVGGGLVIVAGVPPHYTDVQRLGSTSPASNQFSLFLVHFTTLILVVSLGIAISVKPDITLVSPQCSVGGDSMEDPEEGGLLSSKSRALIFYCNDL